MTKSFTKDNFLDIYCPFCFCAQTACTSLEGNILRELGAAENVAEGGGGRSRGAMEEPGGRSGTPAAQTPCTPQKMMPGAAATVVDLDAAVAFSG